MNKQNVDILLVEDDYEDAELTIHAFEKHHIAGHLLHIDDGARALQFLYDESHSRPKVILLDLRMPRVDGIQVLRKLKTDPDRKFIPVIVLISSKEGRNYVESFHLKPDGYIQKPVDPDKFLSVISELGLTLDGVRNHAGR